MIRRIILVILDSVGVGELPDADKYGDIGSNTLGNITKSIQGFSLTNLEKLGIGFIPGVYALGKTENPKACYGRMAEKSQGKDTTTGHWEISGLILDKAFPTYPEGFPIELINKFEVLIGSKTLGNKPASGTAIIAELGDEHMRTGFPIVYTSADSVFQIAAHEDIVPVDRLYEMCKLARGILTGEHAVGRVIARPFTGETGDFCRTDRRRDFSLEPLGRTMLDVIKDSGLEVAAVGKIEDIFVGKGITQAVHTHDNMDGITRTIDYMKKDFSGLIFTNLVDFDMLYGHRNDVIGYASALKEFDDRVPDIIGNLKDDDLLIITADHGCDPTTASTDHSREYVPLLVYGKMIKNGIDLGTRESFADISATVLSLLGLEKLAAGVSFSDVIL